MYVRNPANGRKEAEGFNQENGCVVIPVETPGWSCTTLCGVEHSTSDADGSFFPPSVDQNESSKHKNVLGDFCSDIFNGSENTRIGLWIPRYVTPGMGSLDVQADRVPSNVIHLLDSVPTKSTAAHSEKKKVAAARKSKRSKGSSNKDLMEVYRISRPSGSKDRHSKVATARGPRDRRMRLSVETAVKFFHVQDRLGFDQPSKAVEWLIEKCSSAIDELPRISHSELPTDFKSLSTPVMADTQSHIEELIMNCERDQVAAASSAQRKRSRSSKLTTCSPNVKELKTKAKERDQEGSKRRRRGQAKLSNDVNQKAAETMNFEASCGRRLFEGRQGLLHMHCHDLTGIRTFESTHKNPYFNYAQYSPEVAFPNYPSSSVQSAESFSGRDSTTFSVPSCPFPRVMPSITIDPQSTISEF